ncbi:MAG TPA: hypothetical protein VGO91_15615 [Pyrinomonadaceae bacterium]|jgi:hypothetical protein|nr:hypothetical protein [Pyrinomonadaceae bacterium]
MSILLIILGAFLVYCGWQLLLHLSDEKVHPFFNPLRRYGSWWVNRMSKEDAEGLSLVNGVLFGVVVLFIGMVLVLAGLARLFGWATA